MLRHDCFCVRATSSVLNARQQVIVHGAVDIAFQLRIGRACATASGTAPVHLPHITTLCAVVPVLNGVVSAANRGQPGRWCKDGREQRPTRVRARPQDAAQTPSTTAIT